VRPRLLDLFCGAGGCSVGYHRAGFDVVGVDIDPQPNYPFEFHQGDALELGAEMWRDFDAIHASPPCQSYLNLGKVNRALGREYEHPDLIDPVRAELVDRGLPYVIENVEDAKDRLRDPLRLCGSSFGLPVRRHRLFESNVPLVGPPCNHHWQKVPRYWTGWRPKGEHRLAAVVQVYGNGGGRDEWPDAMGIDWMTPKELAEAIPPAYTEFVGRQLVRFVELRRWHAQEQAA
jgi:DNA (cytosine-5)-methyltransferase 1